MRNSKIMRVVVAGESEGMGGSVQVCLVKKSCSQLAMHREFCKDFDKIK